MNVEFDPLAEKDFIEAIEAIEFFEVQEPGLEDRFRQEVWDAIHAIERWPQGFGEVRPGVRKALLHRFPYKLLYT